MWGDPELAIAGDYAFVAGWGTDFTVIDLSDPHNLFLAGTCQVAPDHTGLALDGNSAYLTNGEFFQLVSVWDPTQPVLYDENPVEWSPVRRMAVAGDYAYVAGGLAMFEHPGLKVYTHRSRLWYVDQDHAEALTINPPEDPINQARLWATATDSIIWELSSDGGLHWEDVRPSGEWCVFDYPGNDLRWRATLVYLGGDINPTCTELEIEWPVGLSDTPDDDVPRTLALHPNLPNPFNPTTTINYSLPAAGRVRLAVYDLQGRLVATLEDGEKPAGHHEVIWNGRTNEGGQVASGVYLARLETVAGEKTSKMTLTK